GSRRGAGDGGALRRPRRRARAGGPRGRQRGAGGTTAIPARGGPRSKVPPRRAPAGGAADHRGGTAAPLARARGGLRRLRRRGVRTPPDRRDPLSRPARGDPDLLGPPSRSGRGRRLRGRGLEGCVVFRRGIALFPRDLPGQEELHPPGRRLLGGGARLPAARSRRLSLRLARGKGASAFRGRAATGLSAQPDGALSVRRASPLQKNHGTGESLARSTVEGAGGRNRPTL